MGSRKSRVLLKLLAVERPGLVSVGRIVEVLSAGDPPTAAEQNVATLVSRLRGALGPGVILGGRQGYRLGGEPGGRVDLDVAARYCEQAEHRVAIAASAARAAAEQAIGLLSAGTALADEPYATWVDRPAASCASWPAGLAWPRPSGASHDDRAGDSPRRSGHRGRPARRGSVPLVHVGVARREPAKALVAYAALRDRLGRELGADPARRPRRCTSPCCDSDPPSPSGPFHPSRAAPSAAGTRVGGPGQRRPPLVGREAETAALREAWGRAAADPGLVMIIGEAGIGKTALAEDLVVQAAESGATVLRTRCYEAERSLFLQPIVEALAPVVARMTAGALRQLLGEHADAAALLPDVAALLGPPPSWRGSPGMERRRSFEALTALLSGLAERNPVLLVVDDLQYAGQSTVEFIHYLARQVHGSRLLAVVTVRAEHATEIGAVLAPVAARVEVGPLGAAAVGQLAHDAGQGGLASSILQRTRGHTLFVVEVLRAMAGGDAGIPESLRSAVQARVRQTGPAADALLRAASVLGAAIDPLTLGELLQLTPANVRSSGASRRWRPGC